jgi:hypothetical protein
MGVSGQHHAPAALYPRGKDPRYPVDKRLGGPQSRSGRRGQKKNPLPLLGIEPRSTSPQSDTILTELPRLLLAFMVHEITWARVHNSPPLFSTTSHFIPEVNKAAVCVSACAYECRGWVVSVPLSHPRAPGFNLGSETDTSEVSVVFVSPFNIFGVSTLKYVTTLPFTSFPIHHSQKSYHPTVYNQCSLKKSSVKGRPTHTNPLHKFLSPVDHEL